MVDIKIIDNRIMHDLKDFQRATVQRIDYLYQNGQNRVLVADEVGMGKTLIARGVISKCMKISLSQNKPLFKVIYVCSNHNIANQNLRKLDINNSLSTSSSLETRLSMQHLRTTEQSHDAKILDKYLQLIPLTPGTSFDIKNNGGWGRERALIYVILTYLDEFAAYKSELKAFLKLGLYQSTWDSYINEYDKRVANCNKASDGIYPQNILRSIRKYNEENHTIDGLINILEKYKNGQEIGSKGREIGKLRVMFAKISVAMLEPSLVIMDEFQRFKSLLHAEAESDLDILAHSFLDGDDTRILLLSATPYKLYSTLEEMEENGQIDEHYDEFLQVMHFLFRGQAPSNFDTVWNDYNIALRELKEGNTAILSIKDRAQEEMYKAFCRTERNSVMESGDYTDDSSVSTKMICPEDIKSYLHMGKLLKDTNAKYSLPVDYVKSAPFLMSFMRKYTVKTDIEKYFRKNKNEIDKANQPLLWLKKSTIDSYSELPKSNARLELLKEKAFENNSESYLWIPPSLPYYDLQGVYKNANNFSKVLVFSQWEMVPRMIGTLISYEAERRTVGKLYKLIKHKKRKNTIYSADAKRRYPTPRLRFNISNNSPKGMSLLCLVYPSSTLANLYNPIDFYNRGLSLKEIERELRTKLRGLTESLGSFERPQNQRQDDRWYYLSPMLLDGVEESIAWVDNWRASIVDDEDSDTYDESGKRGVLLHIEDLKNTLNIVQEEGLGRMPDDLIDVLINMTLGSPAVCIYRSKLNDKIWATELSRVFISNFNSNEATAIVELAYGRGKNDDSHWMNVLKYCKDGCFQAMFDEYYHILKDAVSLAKDADLNLNIYNSMRESLLIHTSTYKVDTFNSFNSRLHDESSRELTMRSGYATSFTKDATDNEKNVNRKESVRNAFNSPLRPFVLATTSIGQEGLDFHNYCRRVMHWNLPSNPIDLEQREGRINRYKCLAIRQNIAKVYKDINMQDDVWSEMFEKAIKERKEGQSELIPYWCFGENQKVKIERIVGMYPISKDKINYERMIKILSLYRLTMGQPRQEELLEYLFDTFNDTSFLKDLFIDLSPFNKEVLLALEEENIEVDDILSSSPEMPISLENNWKSNFLRDLLREDAAITENFDLAWENCVVGLSHDNAKATIIKYYQEGKSIEQIANEMNLSEAEVKNLKKLGMRFINNPNIISQFKK